MKYTFIFRNFLLIVFISTSANRCNPGQDNFNFVTHSYKLLNLLKDNNQKEFLRFSEQSQREEFKYSLPRYITFIQLFFKESKNGIPIITLDTIPDHLGRINCKCELFPKGTSTISATSVYFFFGPFTLFDKEKVTGIELDFVDRFDSVFSPVRH
jgi:hypothetical protein